MDVFFPETVNSLTAINSLPIDILQDIKEINLQFSSTKHYYTITVCWIMLFFKSPSSVQIVNLCSRPDSFQNICFSSTVWTYLRTVDVAQEPPAGHRQSGKSYPNPYLRRMSMTESVYKIIELVGSSPVSWEEATQNAVKAAGLSLRDLRIAEVVTLDMKIEDGKAAAFRSRVKLSFKLLSD
jgi:hypothetical protein